MSYSSEDYKNYILDQMRLLEGISVRRMFGGYGFYLSPSLKGSCINNIALGAGNNKFFAILSGNQLYFKTNEKTKKEYKKYGSVFFRPSPKQKLKNYYEVPSEIIEDSQKLKEWSEQAAG